MNTAAGAALNIAAGADAAGAVGAALKNVTVIADAAGDADAAMNADAAGGAALKTVTVIADAAGDADAALNAGAEGAALRIAAADAALNAGAAGAAGAALIAAATDASLSAAADEESSYELSLEEQVELGDAVLAINKGLGDVLVSPQEQFSDALDAPKSLGGICRSPLIHKEVSVEPRQSERIKKQQSGDEDLVQKAIRRAKLRNLESINPSYPFDRALAEGLGKPAETGPEGVHAEWKYSSGGYGEANFLCSWVAV